MKQEESINETSTPQPSKATKRRIKYDPVITLGELDVPLRGRRNPMSSVLVHTISGMESAPRVRESLALAYWPRAVGEMAAAATKPESVRDGLLIVRTKNSVWSHELTFYKVKIIENLNRMLEGRVITDIKFKAMGVKLKDKPVPAMPSIDELNAVVLEDHEEETLQESLEKAAQLPSDHVRQVISGRLIQEAKLRHWRLEHSWRLCLRCSAAHNTSDDLCPLCLM